MHPRRPLYVVALTVLLTTVFLVTNGENNGLYMALTAAVLLSVVLVTPCLRRIGVAYLLCFGVMLAALSTYLYHSARVQPLQQFDGATAQVTGRILKLPQNEQGRYTLIVTDSNSLPQGTRLAVTVETAQEDAQPYDVVSGAVSLFITQNRNSHADGIFLAGTMQILGVQKGVPRWYERVSDTLRTGLLEGIFAVLPAREAGFVAGVCVGDVSAVETDVVEDFRKSGLAHLTVVSGLHMTIFSGAVLALLKLLQARRSVAVAVSLLVLWAFMLMVGFSFSVIRAAVMLHCLLLGGAFRRRADSRTSLSVALLLIVTANPYAVCDVGFLLSFAATWGIVVMYPMWDALLRSLPFINTHAWIKTLCAPVGVSLAAMLFTAPIMASVFGTLALLTPLANVLTGEPVGVMLPLALAGGILYQIPLLQIPAKLCLKGAGLLARWIMAVARWIADISIASLQIRHPVWLVLLILLPFTVYAAAKLRGKRGVAHVVLANIVTAACIFGIFHGAYRDAVWIRVADAGYSTAVVVESKDRTVAVISGGNAFACERARQYIASCGVDALDVLVVTDGRNASHEALDALLTAIPAKTVVCPAEDTYDGVTTYICDGIPLTLTDRFTLATYEGWWRLDIDATRILFSTRGGLFADLPAEWRSAHLMVVRQSVPDDMQLLTARHAVVVCTDEHLSSVRKQLPLDAYPVTFTAIHGDAAFGTTGKGDLVTADNLWL